MRRDAASNRAWQFDFTAFRNNPLVYNSESRRGFTCLAFPFLAEKLAAGVYHTILGSWAEGDPERDLFQSYWGNVFEQFVNDRLREEYPASVLTNRLYAGPYFERKKFRSIEVSDSVLDYGDSLIILEHKGGYLSVDEKYGDDPDRLLKGVATKFGLDKAIKQLSRGIGILFVEDLRSTARAAILGELLEFLDSKLNPEPRPRPRLVRPGERILPLQLTYRQFEAVLREWDVYTFLEMSRMSRGILSATVAARLAGGDYDPGAAETAALKLSDLAGFLWRSLEAGPGAADRIHDEYYAEDQARHFEGLYQSPEHVANALRTEYGWLPPPEEMFLKLGQPAQLIIVRDGILQRAVDNYGRGVGLKREREEAERRETKRLAEERRKVDEAVRRMRELDKSQCAFCGKKLVSHLSYVRTTGGAYEVLERSYFAPDSTKFNADDVVLSCKSCASKLGTPEGAGMTPAFGRYSSSSVL